MTTPADGRNRATNNSIFDQTSVQNLSGQSNGRVYSSNSSQQNNQVQQVYDQAIQSQNSNDNVQTDENLSDFVVKYNSSLRNNAAQINREKGRNYLQEFTEIEEEEDIPRARAGLGVLTTMRAAVDPKLKEAVLDGMIENLRIDPVTEKSATGLSEFADDLMIQLDRNSIHKETINIQKKFICAFRLTGCLTLLQYARWTVNGNIEEFKQDLKVTTVNLKALNTQDDPHLAYEIEFAYEVFEKFRTDKNQLLASIKILYGLVDTAAKLYKADLSGISELANSFKTLKINSRWFKYAFIIHSLAKDVKNDVADLQVLQLFYEQKKNEILRLDWKIAYTFVQEIGWIALSGKTLEIRLNAFSCLEAFNRCSEFENHYTFIESAKRLEKPKVIDTNLVIQSITIDYLIKLATDAVEPEIRLRAIQSIYGYLKSPPMKSSPAENGFLDKMKGFFSEDLSQSFKAKLMKRLTMLFPNQENSNSSQLTEEQLLRKAIELNPKNSQFFQDQLNQLGGVQMDNNALDDNNNTPQIEQINRIAPGKESQNIFGGIKYDRLPSDQVGSLPGLYVFASCTNDSCEKKEWVRCGDEGTFNIHDLESTIKCSSCNGEIEIDKSALCGCTGNLEMNVDVNDGKNTKTTNEAISFEKGWAQIVETLVKFNYLEFEI